jgi:hypothetical protein
VVAPNISNSTPKNLVTNLGSTISAGIGGNPGYP